ncbi:MAG: transposase [Planctomycetota bacterium]|nr:transposase [Planctomycetota bacterium]
MEVNLVTTLLDPQAYPADELIELGRGRWSAELNIRHLKTTMGLEILKCKTVAGVLKELAIFLLVYNLVRAVMLDASAEQGVPPDRISFADALAAVRCSRCGQALVALLVNPIRRNRLEPRAVKRRPKEYDRLNRPRQEMRNALKTAAKRLN